MADPGILNSNLSPVKANGEVLLRSAASFAMRGRTMAPVSINLLFHTLTPAAICNGLQDFSELIAQVDRDDGRRRFVSSQAVVVAGACHRKPQKILMLIYSSDHCC